MKRWLVVSMAMLGLTLGACGSVEKSGDGGGGSTETWTPMADGDAIVGQWVTEGSDSVTFEGNGRYRWAKEIPCGGPPCPTMNENGTYRVAHGKLYMTPSSGGDSIIEFAFADQQTHLSLTDNRGTKMYQKR